MVRALSTLTRAHASRITQLLNDKSARTSEGAFVVEGAKLCQDLIHRHPESIVSLLVSSQYLARENPASRSLRLRLPVQQFTCAPGPFARLSDVESPQGILAVVRQPQWDEAAIWRRGRVLGLYGEQLQDPVNVGAIIRTAAALNLTGLWLSTGSADWFGPKVVRAAAGAVLSLPIFSVRNARTFAAHRCALYAAVLPSGHASASIRSIRAVPSRLMIAVGNEGSGLTSDTVKAADVAFSIPMAKDAESLNVAATAAIAGFYFSGLDTTSDPPPR